MDEDSEIARQVEALDEAVRRMLREDLRVQLVAFQNALARDDIADAIQNAHTIRGSAAFCRLDALQRAATAVETCLNDRRQDASAIQNFETHALRVVRAIEQSRHE